MIEIYSDKTPECPPGMILRQVYLDRGGHGDQVTYFWPDKYCLYTPEEYEDIFGKDEDGDEDGDGKPEVKK